MRRIGIFLGLFFLCVVFAIVFYRLTWAFILIPFNQDVMYLFYAFDSFPVTYLSVVIFV